MASSSLILKEVRYANAGFSKLTSMLYLAKFFGLDPFFIFWKLSPSLTIDDVECEVDMNLLLFYA